MRLSDGKRMVRLLLAPLLIAFFSPPLFSSEPEVLNVGLHKSIVNSRIPEKDLMVGMKLFLNELATEQHVTVNITFYTDDKKLSDDFISGKLNYISADALTYIRYIPADLLDVGTTAYKNNKENSSILLVMGLSDDNRPLQEKLAGKIAISDDSVSELYLKTLMLESGLKNQPDLISTKSHQQSILKLFFGQADIALMDRSSYLVAAELNPQLLQRLKTIKSVPLSLGSVSFMRKGISPSLRKKVIDFNAVLNNTSRGQQLMRLFHSDHMDVCEPSDLKNVRDLYARYQKLGSSKKEGSR